MPCGFRATWASSMPCDFSTMWDLQMSFSPSQPMVPQRRTPSVPGGLSGAHPRAGERPSLPHLPRTRLRNPLDYGYSTGPAARRQFLHNSKLCVLAMYYYTLRPAALAPCAAQRDCAGISGSWPARFCRPASTPLEAAHPAGAPPGTIALNAQDLTEYGSGR